MSKVMSSRCTSRHGLVLAAIAITFRLMKPSCAFNSLTYFPYGIPGSRRITKASLVKHEDLHERSAVFPSFGSCIATSVRQRPACFMTAPIPSSTHDGYADQETGRGSLFDDVDELSQRLEEATRRREERRRYMQSTSEGTSRKNILGPNHGETSESISDKTGESLESDLTQPEESKMQQESKEGSMYSEHNKYLPNENTDRSSIGNNSRTSTEENFSGESRQREKKGATSFESENMREEEYPYSKTYGRNSKFDDESRPPRRQRGSNMSRSTTARGRYNGDQDEDKRSWDDSRDDYDPIYDRDQYTDDFIDESTNSRQKSGYTWETHGSSSIFLPASRPKAIIHFVGGTFFGSYPRKFYGPLLERIARKCESAIVATPIPITLPGSGLANRLEDWITDAEYESDGGGSTKNPLDHVRLAQTIQRDFNQAYRDVLLDEYCRTNGEVSESQKFMQTVPIIGMGHSLGARLQALSCSYPAISNQYLSMGRGDKLIRSGREGMIYLGFANWGAKESIPGLEALERKSREQKKKSQRDEDKATGRAKPRREGDRGSKRQNREGGGRRDDVWGERMSQSRRDDDKSEAEELRRNRPTRRGRQYASRSGRRIGNDETRRGNRQYDRYNDEFDDDDLDLIDMFTGVLSRVTTRARKIGEGLTPDAEDLEFFPSPDELWDDLSSPRGYYRENCPNNLIVQFEDDPIDQGSRLARTLLDANGEGSKVSTRDDGVESDSNNSTKAPIHDVKFARLDGGHLTPVSIQESIRRFLPQGTMSMLSSSADFVLRQLGEEPAGKSGRKKHEQEDVADTVASYIREQVCMEESNERVHETL